MFPEESPTSQDLQQAHAQTLHAKYRVTQQNTPLRSHSSPAEEKTNALLKENSSKRT